MKIQLLDLPKEIEKAFQDWYGDINHNMIDDEVIKEFQTSVYPHIGKIAGKENRKFQENYFNNVTSVWKHAEKLKLSMDIMDIIWMTSLKPIIEWEKNNSSRVHKGSPYFYLGTSYVTNRNIEKGFIYIHEAYEEDKKTYYEDHPDKVDELPKTPAYLTLSLNQSKLNYFRSWVIQITDYLEDEYINSFNKKYTENITFTDLSCKFLSNPQLNDLVFLFSYAISRIYDIEQNKHIYDKTNNLSSQIISQIYFDLLRIIEGLIFIKEVTKEKYFTGHIKYFAKESNIYSVDTTYKKIGEFEAERKNNPQKAFDELLSKNFSFSDGIRLNENEIDLILALGIRNYYAHNNEPLFVFCENKYDIFKRLVHLLVAVITYLF